MSFLNDYKHYVTIREVPKYPNTSDPVQHCYSSTSFSTNGLLKLFAAGTTPQSCVLLRFRDTIQLQ